MENTSYRLTYPIYGLSLLLICGCSSRTTSLADNSQALPNETAVTAVSSQNEVSIAQLLNQSKASYILNIQQPLWINQNLDQPLWRVSVSRHDFDKVEFDVNQQKIQNKMFFKSAGEYRLNVQSIVQKTQAGAPPNAIQQQVTIIVQDN